MLAAPSGADRCAAFKCLGQWLPVGREQNGQVVLVGHGREAFEDVGKVTLWICVRGVPNRLPPLLPLARWGSYVSTPFGGAGASYDAPAI
jgi:hypothetical protein